jgi:hypothetical protein
MGSQKTPENSGVPVGMAYLSKPGPKISFLDFLTLMIESSE